jgi:5,10-methylenetetrahydromethanopterin reductase
MTVVGGTGAVLRDALPWEDAREVAGTAEETGFAAVFVPEIAGREAFSTLTGLGAATDRILLGTGVVAMQTRRPETTAMAAATVQDVSEGRAILGIGAGHDPGGTPPGPVERLREYVRVVRSLLEGEAVTSVLYGVEGTRLELSAVRPPPIWLAALGDRMVDLAAQTADGVC